MEIERGELVAAVAVRIVRNHGLHSSSAQNTSVRLPGVPEKSIMTVSRACCELQVCAVRLPLGGAVKVYHTVP